MRVIAALLVCATTAQAQPGPGQPIASDAKHFYDDGVRHYSAERYDQAIEAFKQAYARQPTPSLLYNIAQAYRLKGPKTCGIALDYYRAYLRDKPDASDRELVAKQATEMEDCVRREPQLREDTTPVAASPPAVPVPASATTVEPPVEPPVEPSLEPPVAQRHRALPRLVVGIGAVVLVTGGVLQSVARWRYANLEDECPCPSDTWQDWRRVELTSYGLMIAGGATMAAAMIWWRRSPATGLQAAQLVPSTHTIGVVAVGAF